MRQRVPVRRAPGTVVSSVDLRPSPEPIQAKREGRPDLSAWMSSAERLGHDFRRVEIGLGCPKPASGARIGRSSRSSANHRERHSPGCSCPGCARSAEIARGPATAERASAGREDGSVIQLCKSCNNNSCQNGEKCGVKPSVSNVYESWSPSQTTSMQIETPWGSVSAQQKRGAPFIRSKAQNYKKAKLKTDYKDFNRALRNNSGKADVDHEIAKDLLEKKSDFLKTDLQKRGAAMLYTTVGLAENWRKEGAEKIHRALLRQVQQKEIDLDEVNKRFKYVESADEGRKQVARIQDVLGKRAPLKDLSEEEQKIISNLSGGEDDLSSDDEQREKKNDISKKRLFSEKHKDSERERLKKYKEKKKKQKI